MKNLFLFIAMLPIFGFGQIKLETKKTQTSTNSYIKSVDNLTLDAAFEITKRVTEKATSLNKNVAIAVLDASGNVLLLTRPNDVGPHNAEAARRKAFTALSTKTATLALLRNAASNPDTNNLNTLPELLLLSGGSPIWYKGTVIGSIGVAGGGSVENDDILAKAAEITEIGITTTK